MKGVRRATPFFLLSLGGGLIFLFALGAAAKPVLAEKKSASVLPDFSLPLLDGKMIRLSDYRGKNPVLLVFFATWCGPCNIEVPVLNRMYEKYKPRGVIMLAVDVQESKEWVERWAKKRGVKYPIVLDQKGSVIEKYGIYSVPTNILLDFDGQVVFWHNILPSERHLDEVLSKSHKDSGW